MLNEGSAKLLDKSPEDILQRQLTDILNNFEEFLFIQDNLDIAQIEQVLDSVKDCLADIDQIDDIDQLLPSLESIKSDESLALKMFKQFLTLRGKSALYKSTFNINNIEINAIDNRELQMKALYTSTVKSNAIDNRVIENNTIESREIGTTAQETAQEATAQETRAQETRDLESSTESYNDALNDFMNHSYQTQEQKVEKENIHDSIRIQTQETHTKIGADQIFYNKELEDQINDDNKNLKRFVQMLKIEKNLSNNSVEAYIRDVQQFLVFQKSVQIQNVQKLAQTYLEKLQNEQIETSSILRKFSAIKQFYKFQDIYINIRLPKANKPLKIVNYKQILTLLEHVDNKRDKAFIYLLFATGARISEIINLKLEQIEYCLKRRTGHFNLMGKGDKERVVFLTDSGMDALQDYLDTRTDNSKFVFINSRKVSDADSAESRSEKTKDRKNISSDSSDNHAVAQSNNQTDKYDKNGKQTDGQNVRQSDKQVITQIDRPLTRQWAFKMIDALCKKSNIPHLHPHDFRHAQAMLLLDSGTDLVSIQNILGHKHLSTTEKYLQLHWSHLVDNVKLLDVKTKLIAKTSNQNS